MDRRDIRLDGLEVERWGLGKEEGMGPGGQEFGRDHCGIHRSPPGPQLFLSVQPSVFVPTFLMLGPTQA